jgi:hypothetical protein
MTTRRTILAGGLASLLPLRAVAQQTPVGVERFALWPGAAPGGPTPAVTDTWVKRSPTGAVDDIAWPHVATPMFTVVRPAMPRRRL